MTVELRAERDGDSVAVGQIVKARVAKVLPGIQSAFLDIGLGRDAFLHVADLILPGEAVAALEETDLDQLPVVGIEALEEDVASPSASPGRRRLETLRAAPIEDRLNEGSELLVQVEREAIGSKGARVTCSISLPGRYLVFLPQWSYCGISRRITEPEERARLREILATLSIVTGGFIVRTAGRDADAAAFRADAEALYATWVDIQRNAAKATAPARIHGDLDLPLRLLRDAPHDGVDRILVDSPEVYERAHLYLRELDSVLGAKLSLHTGPTPLFEAHGVNQEIEKALRPKVWLRSGGSVVIQQTEALVSIDVNTGKFLGKRSPEETVLRTNLEAAAEIARQLRLRDLGGIIVVDFIDMEQPDSRQQVIAAFELALRRDRARTKIIGLSELGLLQLTRKRTRPGLGAALTRECPRCAGHGRVKSPEMVAFEALSEVRRLAQVLDGQRVTVRVVPEIARAVMLALQTSWFDSERGLADRIHVEEDPTARPDAFDLLVM